MMTCDKQVVASSTFGKVIGMGSRTNWKVNKSHAESYLYVKQALPQSPSSFHPLE